jgi:aquaporin Z
VDVRRYLAELIGTFILVGVGSMAILAANTAGVPVLLAVPFGFGLALLAAIQVGGHVSGGHYNPAVTLGALLDRRIAAPDAAIYIAAQVVGAIAGSAAMFLIGATREEIAGTTTHPEGGDAMIGFASETMLTADYVVVILTDTKRAANYAIVAIPLTLIAIHFAGIPFSGASVNPARSLGPALVSGDLNEIWIYLTAPFVGALIGYGIFKALDIEPDSAPTEVVPEHEPVIDEAAA